MNRQIFESPARAPFHRDSSLLERSSAFESRTRVWDEVLSSRLSIDELSCELYEMNTWPWFEMNVNDNELVVNHKKKPLNEEQWQTILKLVVKNKEVQNRE
eukprot:354742_1